MWKVLQGGKMKRKYDDNEYTNSCKARNAIEKLGYESPGNSETFNQAVTYVLACILEELVEIREKLDELV